MTEIITSKTDTHKNYFYNQALPELKLYQPERNITQQNTQP